MLEKWEMNIHTMTTETDEIICRNRIYQCQCGFVGREQAAEEHQLKCELPMEQIT